MKINYSKVLKSDSPVELAQGIVSMERELPGYESAFTLAEKASSELSRARIAGDPTYKERDFIQARESQERSRQDLEAANGILRDLRDRLKKVLERHREDELEACESLRVSLDAEYQKGKREILDRAAFFQACFRSIAGYLLPIDFGFVLLPEDAQFYQDAIAREASKLPKPSLSDRKAALISRRNNAQEMILGEEVERLLSEARGDKKDSKNV